MNLGTLDGKARLAERCKPLLAQIPDGAFGDLMRQRLTELTGVGARASAPETDVQTQRARNAPAVHAPKQSLAERDRTTLHQPALAMMLEPPNRFASSAEPGWRAGGHGRAGCRQRPEITTGALLEHFSDREEVVALQKARHEDVAG